MDTAVQEYIARQPSPQKDVLKKLRSVIVKTISGISEEMKYGVPWYGDLFYLVGLKDHVNIGFCIEGLTKKELDLFEGQGKTTRHIKVYSPQDLDEKKIVKLLKLVWARN